MKTDSERADGFTYSTCAVCGKRFSRTQEYVYRRTYKNRLIFFCRYNHMRDWDREQEAKHAAAVSANDAARKAKSK